MGGQVAYKMNSAWKILGIIGIAGVAYWYGDKNGHMRCTVKHQIELQEQIDTGEKLKADAIEVARQRDDLVRQLEVQANEDPVIVTQCLSPGRVRRLNSIDQKR